MNIGELKEAEQCGAHFVNYETGVKPDIAQGVMISGVVDCIHKVTIEKDVFTGHDVMFLTGSHNYYKFGEDRKREGGGGPITIKEGAWIATRAIVIGPCTIGKHAVVGAGAIVTHDVPDYAVVAGNPARIIKMIPHDGQDDKQPVIAYTIGSGKYAEYALKLKTSFKKFHPNIPFIIFDDDDVQNAEESGYGWGRNYAFLGSLFQEDYKKVIHIDADCIVTGPLTELIEAKEDVVGCLNFGEEFIMKHGLRGVSAVGEVPYDDFLTAGIFAINNPAVWKHWKHGTFTKWNNFEFKDPSPIMIEQDVFNLIFYSKQYSTRVVDRTDCYYGTQSREKWDKLYMDGDRVMLENREVKILHWAGGSGVKKLAYREDGIPEEVCKRLDYLIT